MGGWLHHERLATHWPRLQVVAVQHRPIRPFPQVGLVSFVYTHLALAGASEPRPGIINSLFFFFFFFSLFSEWHSGETATCLFNSPHEDAVLPRVLPGKLLSLDAQCRMDRGTSACFVSIVFAFLLIIAAVRLLRSVFELTPPNWIFFLKNSHNRKTIESAPSCFVSTRRPVTASPTDRRPKVLLAVTAR